MGTPPRVFTTFSKPTKFTDRKWFTRKPVMAWTTWATRAGPPADWARSERCSIVLATPNQAYPAGLRGEQGSHDDRVETLRGVRGARQRHAIHASPRHRELRGARRAVAGRHRVVLGRGGEGSGDRVLPAVRNGSGHRRRGSVGQVVRG